jgi:hypothetical protein
MLCVLLGCLIHFRQSQSIGYPHMNGEVQPKVFPEKTLDAYVSEAHNQLIIGAAAELLFVLLPLLVLAIILTFRGDAANILSTAEWSFAAAILFGQGLIRVVRATNEHGQFRTEPIVFIAACILVLGLVPSLVILSVFLTNEGQEPTMLMILSQLGLFLLSVGSYLFCSMAPGHALGRRKFVAEQEKRQSQTL